ncbi:MULTISPECIES: urate hydroxylase PuuD [unclassified Agarivorans]|uniref:urate hydroxylase PuuD n=1 Tax=unclassified Agarivorans TaxID=2636026 RepID=UPI0026E397DC|nr:MULTISPECIES: urate hydroxylase PuuD [unclassified Agarivorans]MDO6687077.1 urate hydroxylase PuuD [Agarivorans sp. 3_MG-2023]MDO6713511.1 urate hydroxylase PuuD [Agarivorans sp. 2_MG-2023]
MWPQLYEWLALFIKWFHVIAGIAWIGASFYFVWLDNNLKTPPDWKKQKGIKGDLWAVHGGGFYEVAKYQVGPEKMPEKLHWFKWEAYSTWISGTLLLFWIYYLRADAYLIDPQIMALGTTQAIALGVGGITLGFALYEGLLRSPIANKPLLLSLSLVIIGALFCYGFTQVFSGRGAFIHMGALIGTIMVANVWIKIIPGQKQMVAQVSAGETVDPAPGLEAKRRSVHNNYLTLPVIFLMISNHYPMIYQHSHSWLILCTLIGLSAWIRHFFNLKHQGVHKPAIIVSGAAGLLILAVFLSWSGSQAKLVSLAEDMQTGLNTEQQQIMTIINQRCASCHSRATTDDMFTAAQGGVMLDSWQDVERWKQRIVARATETKDMPFLNKTQITEGERQMLKQVLGAP